MRTQNHQGRKYRDHRIYVATAVFVLSIIVLPVASPNASAQSPFQLPPKQIGQSTVQQLGEPAMIEAKVLRNPVYNSGKFTDGPQVAPVSMTTPARILNQPDQSQSTSQIRVNIRFLAVDDATRDAIYQQLGSDNIKTQTQRVALIDPKTQLSAQVDKGSHLRSSRQVLSTSCVSTCILNSEMAQELLGQVEKSPLSKLSAAPSIILFDGQDGQLTEMVQRPFVVDVPEKLDADTAALKPKPEGNPIIQVLDEGTAMRVKISARDTNRFHVVSDLTYTRILDFRSQRVYGVEPSKATIQVPMHQVESASVAEEMSFGHTLLIDPYVTRETEFKSERSVPILGKIPYVNRSFKNVAMAKVNSNLMVLLEPVLMK